VDPIATPAPALVLESPLPPVATAAEPPSAVPASDVAHTDEGSGVRQVLLNNQRGIVREVCVPVVLNRCS
jgi:hypothetical protein